MVEDDAGLDGYGQGTRLALLRVPATTDVSSESFRPRCKEIGTKSLVSFVAGRCCSLHAGGVWRGTRRKPSGSALLERSEKARPSKKSELQAELGLAFCDPAFLPIGQDDVRH